MILGFVQGVSEFLPISSSGHLVILQHLFGISEPQMLFDVMLHVGTLAAIILVFRKDVWELTRAFFTMPFRGREDYRSSDRLLIAVVVGCIPTVVIGVAFSGLFERTFSSMITAGIGLIITGFILMSTGLRKNGTAHEGGYVSLAQALIVGTAQGFALFPGISRSGTTIAAALLIGVERELSVRFSFLLAIPAIIGALMFQLKDHIGGGNAITGAPALVVMLSGTVTAGFVGVISLMLLRGIVRKGRISLFAYYCWAVGLAATALSAING